MKNERTPRTLAETTFQTGYQSANVSRPDRVYGHILAVGIGIALGLLLVKGLT
jgi:hypothetical protein